MTEQHHSTPAERHATNPNVLGTDRSLPALPNKYNTVIHATDVESETHHPIFRSDDALLSRTEKLRDIIGKFWLWEILAYCFSLACMGAVIGVLLYEDGKRLDRWGLKISPNAVISFIVTLAKSSFLLAITEIISQLKWLHYHDKSHKLSHLKLFDEASRGPFGSLKLLIAGHKVTLLASCAAGIMLAALFVDPFVQLVLSFPSRGTLATTESASFQTAQLYDPNQYLLDGHDTAATGMFWVHATVQDMMLTLTRSWIRQHQHASSNFGRSVQRYRPASSVLSYRELYLDRSHHTWCLRFM